jgi:RNA polymerase sigma-70 factor, ECF subfamily
MKDKRLQVNNLPIRGQTDAELVTLAQSRSEGAFTELMRRHSQNSLKLATSILRDATEGEDQVQIAYTNAWRHLDGFKQDASFSTWISRIVTNQCLMRLRKKRRAKVVSLEAGTGDNLTLADRINDSADTPDVRAEKLDMAALLRDEVAKLPVLLREVLVLRHLEEVPTAQTASQLGISVAATKSRLQRARAELHTRMSRRVDHLRTVA